MAVDKATQERWEREDNVPPGTYDAHQIKPVWDDVGPIVTEPYGGLSAIGFEQPTTTKHTVNPALDAHDARAAVDALLHDAVDAAELGDWELVESLAGSAQKLARFC